MKKFSVTGLILHRPVTILMMTIMVIGFGLFSLSKLKITLYPPFNIPVLAISTNYKSVSPEDVIRLLVEPIEGAVSAIENIESLEANARRGGAFIILRLKPGTDIRYTELKVREAIDRIRAQLPSEATDPIIFQFDPENRPIMRLSVEGENRGLDELRQIALDFVEPYLERIDGIASVDTRGGLERTIYVDLDPMLMGQFKMVPSEVENAIRTNNVQLPVGNLIADRVNYNVRAESMYTSIAQIMQTIVRRNEDGSIIRVMDVAEVKDTFAQITTLVEVNGNNSVTVEVQKKSDANTLDVALAVQEVIPEIESKLPPGSRINILTNEGQFIESSISNLAQTALIALIVVILILLIFMGGWRVALVVAMSIPVSMAATFAGMYAVGLTLNVISITGLALAVGLLVDNSIVVSESIAGKLEEGYSRFQACLKGTNEVIGALLGSTLTTLGVFIPILGISGFQGVFFRELALTISIAISISFIAAIILIPVLSSLILSEKEFEHKGLMFRILAKLEHWYGISLGWMLRHKWLVVVLIIAVLYGIVKLFGNIESALFPESDSGEINITVELTSGTKLVETAEVIRTFASQIQKLPEAKIVVTKIGQSRRDTETNRGEITLTLVDQSKRTKSTDDISLELRRSLTKPGVTVNISAAGGGIGFRGGWGGGRGVRVSLFGAETEVLQAISNRIEMVMLQDTNIISVDNPRTNPAPELVYNVDRERINRIGASLNEVANNLKTQARGSLVGQFREDGREIPIEVRAREASLASREDLRNLQVLQRGEQRLSVSALGGFERVQSLSRIARRDRETVLDVSIVGKGSDTEYQQQIRDFFAQEVIMPEGYRYEFTGDFTAQQQGNNEMMMALLFALALTYMVMASLFENLKDPFIVMFTIPLAFFGSLLLLTITGTKLYAPASIGIVILIGIVVNNGIVLVDYIHQFTTNNQHNGLGYAQNFIKAARRRMRPIILTALTTICSMIPLAMEIGTGSETWSPLAKSVIGGLLFSTVLTLFVLPSLLAGINKNRRAEFKSF